MLRPPSLSQDLYCDRCKEDAYKKASKEPKGVSELALFSSEVEEIVNEFLPSAMPNLGPLDLMHRLVLRLTRVREALIWEDGSVRHAALELEAASRPFARDLQVHTCHDASQVRLDFGPEGELFLAELHLTELLTLGTKKPTPGNAKPQLPKAADDETAHEDLDDEQAALQAHAQACDIFLAKVWSALEEEGKTKERQASTPGEEVDDEEQSAFHPEYLCRTHWLAGLLESWRGRVKEAAEHLEECSQRLSQLEGLGAPVHVDLPHCLRYPVLSSEVVTAKKKQLLELDDTEATRKLVQAFRKGVEASKGGTPQAYKALVSLVKRRFLLYESASASDRMRKAEELLMDFLIHEAQGLLDDGKVGRLKCWCEDLDSFIDAIEHESILWLMLMACAQCKDLSSVVVLLLTVIQYLTEIDPWGNALIARFVRATPEMSPRIQPEVAKLNVYLLEALSQLLHMALRKGWPKDEAVAPLVQSMLGPGLLSIARFSLLPKSTVMLNTVLHAERTLAPLLSEDRGVALSRAVFRGMCGVLSDSHLVPDLALNYDNTKAAQIYVRATLAHLCDTAETQIQHFKRPLLPNFLSQTELDCLMEDVCALYRLADRSPKDYGFLNFSSLLALTMLIDQHPGLTRLERLEWMQLAHAGLAEKVVLKELKGTVYLASGFGDCSADDARFLRFVLQASSDEMDAEGSNDDSALQERAQELTVQCLRCLYKIDVSTAAYSCVDHGTAERKPTTLQEAMVLATFCLRYLEEEPGRSRSAIKTALRLVHQYQQKPVPVFQTPLVATQKFAELEGFLFRGGAASGPVVPMWLTFGKELGEDDEELALDDPTSYTDYDKLETMVEDPSALLHVYRRFYHYLGDLMPPPRKKKGTQDTESFHVYEEDCRTNMRIHFSDLRFNPRSLATWSLLTDTVNSLLLLYLDHCPPFTHETPASLALEESLRSSADVSLEPFLSAFVGYKMSPPAARLRACLAKTPLATFLPPEPTPQAPRPTVPTADDSTTEPLNPAASLMPVAPSADPPPPPADDLDLTWAFLVSTAYRVLLERCLGVLRTMLDRALEADPTDDKAAAQRVEVSMRLATMSYMRRSSLAKEDPRQLTLLEDTYKHVQEAQALEVKFGLSRPRWDIAYFMGKAVQKSRVLKYPGKTYADIESLEPGWLESFLSLYQRAHDLAETKGNKTAAYYRLHAARIKVLRSELRDGDHALPPNPMILKILMSYPSSGAAVVDEEAAESTDGLWLSRWGVLRDCVAAMVQCREKDKWDARSVYCRARTLQQLPGWEPPGRSEEERVVLYAGLCSPKDMVSEARDVMCQLYDKRRPQICALWMPDECKDHFEVVNQRNRKYESLRWRYTHYYLELLRACEDYPRVLELFKWLRGGSGKDPSICVARMQTETTESLVELLGLRLAREVDGSVEVRGLMEVCYDLYLELMEEQYLQLQMGEVAGPEVGDLIRKVEEALVMARSKVAGPADAAATASGAVERTEAEAQEEEVSLEQSLKYCHEAWPVKQGEAKLERMRSGGRRRRRRRTSAGANGEEREEEEQAGPKRQKSGGEEDASVAAPPAQDDDMEEVEDEELIEVVRRRVQTFGGPDQQRGALPQGALTVAQRSAANQSDAEDEILLDDAAEGSAVSSRDEVGSKQDDDGDDMIE